MFEIVEKKGQIVIRLTAGDSAEIETQPFIDSDTNKIFDFMLSLLHLNKSGVSELDIHSVNLHLLLVLLLLEFKQPFVNLLIGQPQPPAK